MAKSLYEILEVSATATKEAIDAAHTRLSEKFDPESAQNRGRSDAMLQYKAVREAYAVLGNPDRRASYDRTHPAPGVIAVRAIPRSTVYEDEEPFWDLKKAMVALLIVIAGGFFYVRYQHDREVEALERARLEAIKKQEAERLRAEREERALEVTGRLIEQQQAMQQEAELRTFSQEVNRNQRDRERTEQAEARRQEYERRQEEYRRAAEERAATARARAEVAREERWVRQREAEERYRRPSVVVIPDLRQRR
jgi:curved DNA-binding protein CbpA